MNRYIFGILASPLYLLLLSWFHFFNTKSLGVDNFPIYPLSLRYFLGILMFIFYIIGFFSLYKLLKNLAILEDKALKKIVFIVIALSFFTLPILSNDIFSYICYSESFLNGYKVYSNFDARAQCSIYNLLNIEYLNLNCKYGPFNLLISSIANIFSNNNLMVNIFVHKLIYTFFALIYVNYSLKLITNDKNYILLLLCPIWYIQGLGQLHNDLISVSLIVASIYFLKNSQNKIIPIILISISIFSKLNYLLFIILPYFYFSNNTFNSKIKILIFNFIIFLSIGFLFYFPFITSIDDILSPVNSLNNQISINTLSFFLADLLNIFNSNFIENLKITQSFSKLIFFILILLIFVYYAIEKQLNNFSILISILYYGIIYIYSTQIWIWYLMILPLFIKGNLENVKIFLFLVLLLSIFEIFGFAKIDNFILEVLITIVSSVFSLVSILFTYRLFKTLKRKYE